MEVSPFHVVWCDDLAYERLMAEFYLSENDLWFTMFSDDEGTIQIEVLPGGIASSHKIDWPQLKQKMESVESELKLLYKAWKDRSGS